MRLDLILLPVITALTFLLFYDCTRGRIFWEDEVLGWTLLQAPTFSQMIAGWKHGDDGGGLAFYLTGRAWFTVFGSSVIAFRLYSQVCFSTALVFSWLSLRRFYSPLIVAASVLIVWLVSPEVLRHMIEGRFYGLLAASFACGTWLCFRTMNVPQISMPLYLSTFVAHLFITSSHVLGVAYSVVLLVVIFLMDRSKGLSRPKLYGSVVVSWLILLPSFPAIEASAAVGHPHFWTKQPSLFEFVCLYAAFSPLLVPLYAMSGFLLVWKLRSPQGQKLFSIALASRRPVYVFVTICFCVPILFYIEGWFGPPLCIARYLLPIVIATLFATAEILTLSRNLFSAQMPSRGVTQSAAMGMLLFVVLLYDFAYWPPRVPLHYDYRPLLASELPRQSPTVCEDAFAFTEAVAAPQLNPMNCLFLLDWTNSVASDTPPLELTQYHLMQNWKQDGYYADRVEYSEQFLRSTPDFYTISFADVINRLRGDHVLVDRTPIIGSNLHARLQHDSHYRVSLVKTLPLGKSQAYLWHICRLGTSCT